MDPIALTVSAVLTSPKVKEAIQSIAKEALGEGKQALIRRLHPSVRQKAAQNGIRLFIEEWDKELEDTCEFGGALPGYRDQLKKLIEITAADIADGWIRT
jgi:hypothetical protein